MITIVNMPLKHSEIALKKYNHIFHIANRMLNWKDTMIYLYFPLVQYLSFNYSQDFKILINALPWENSGRALPPPLHH